jgi:hypothetical protein
MPEVNLMMSRANHQPPRTAEELFSLYQVREALQQYNDIEKKIEQRKQEKGTLTGH